MYGQRPRNRGGHWGQMPLHFLYLGKKCPFSGMKVPYFHRIEVPFLQNLSALFGQCPLTFEVLPRPLCTGIYNGEPKRKDLNSCVSRNYSKRSNLTENIEGEVYANQDEH